MDGVRWSTTRAPESFSRSSAAADTLSRLASFIARAETKQPARSQGQQPPHLSTYVCSECGKGFPYASAMFQHQELKHTLPKPHQCSSCGQAFSLRSSLQLHKCRCDSFPCDRCHSESGLATPCTAGTSGPGMLQDMSLHCQPHLLDSSPYTCAPCGRGFSQKQALLQHQQAGCSEQPSPSNAVDAVSNVPGPSNRSVTVCQFCFRGFRTEAGLQRHEQTYHAKEQLMALQGHKTKGGHASGETRRGDKNVNKNPNARPNSKKKLLTCRSCDMVFRNTSKLYVHRKEKHSREKTIGQEPRPVTSKCRRGGSYPCQICSKVFFHHLSLRAHYRWHTASSFTAIKNKNQTGCTAKDNTLSGNGPNNEKSSIADHKRVRAGPGRPRKVARLQTKGRDLGRSKAVQEEEEREFPCPSCAEVFPLQSQLREHVELHQSSVRRRQCSVCTNEMDTCNRPGSKRHRLYHCVPCQQGFSAINSFLEHCQEHLRARVEEDSITEGNKQQASNAGVSF